ncbi:unknown [Clostridium sp. CAG:678]|nr:unknown [Clostridium sp. CAG:678]
MGNKGYSIPCRLFYAFENGLSFLIGKQKPLAGAAAHIKAVYTVFDVELNKILDGFEFDAAVFIKRCEQGGK